ncbi:MAG: hypothetical protein KGS61_03470 [Verrucomicrobia bacterium]|nr:hypothetical protein [Verrucomicrobiota bacterium]
MKRPSFMLIAGEPSGDLLGAELLHALRARFARMPDPPSPHAQPLTTDLPPAFFGAGGPRMAAAGLELMLDLTQHSVIGLSDTLKKYFLFKRIFHRLVALARDREPEVIICVDFSGFNRRFAHAVKELVRRRHAWFRNWAPRIVQYVSPQVWASRPGRARQLAADVDLLLSIIPFEQTWYAEHSPQLRVEFVGHPVVDRFRGSGIGGQGTENEAGRKPEFPGPSSDRSGPRDGDSAPLVLLLPGSRPDELRRHLGVVIDAARKIRATRAVRFRLVTPHKDLMGSALLRGAGLFEDSDLHSYDLAGSLAEADVAITKSGTITLECACFGVPAVVFYKTSWPTYCVGRLAVKTRYLAMPNLLAGEPLYPEFIQHSATADNLARAALALLDDPARRAAIKAKLAAVVRSLGPPGASGRAAQAIWSTLVSRPPERV